MEWLCSRVLTAQQLHLIQCNNQIFKRVECRFKLGPMLPNAFRCKEWVACRIESLNPIISNANQISKWLTTDITNRRTTDHRRWITCTLIEKWMFLTTCIPAATKARIISALITTKGRLNLQECLIWKMVRISAILISYNTQWTRIKLTSTQLFSRDNNKLINPK